MRHSLNLMQLVAMAGLLTTATPALSKVSTSSERTPNGLIKTYDVVVDGVTFKTVNIGGKDFEQASLVGVDQHAGVIFNEGQPEIPVVRILVVGEPEIEVQGEKDASLLKARPLNNLLKPSQPSWSKSLKVAPPVSFDLATYQNKALIAEEAFSVEDAGSIRGQAQKLVTLRPFVYNPSGNKYSLRTHFTVKVRQAEVKAESDPATIAFVIGAKFAASPKITALENEKRTHGFRVVRLVVGKDVQNTDVAIRKGLQTLLRTPGMNLRHAVLIGDLEEVTSHTSTNISGVTDHFYRAIDTENYDLDINGPDIGMGRLSVKTEAQLGVVVDKILRYGAGSFGQVDWLNHPLFVTTHDRWEVAEGTHNAVIAKHMAPRGYDRVFPDAIEKGGDKLYPISLHATPAQIVSHMKAGRSIINFSGHGSNTGWEDVTTADVNTFSDPDSLPYVMSNACITGDFRKEPVFAETWLREPQGAIVFWGSMDSTYWDEDDILEKALYDGMFDKGIRAFDLLHQNALSAMWTFYGGANRSKYYWETYVTFGDPSLDFRPSRPDKVVVEGADAIQIGASETTMLVKNEMGAPIAGATVLLRNLDSDVQSSAVTDAQGQVTLKTAVFASGSNEIQLSVFGSAIETFEKPLQMIAANGPYFGFSKWQVNNRVGGGVFVSEVVNLAATIENFGNVAASGGTVTISNLSGPAKIVTGVAPVPAVGAREQVALGSGLQISVLATALRSELIQLTLTWKSNDGATGTTKVSLPITRGDFAVQAVDYGSPDREGVSVSGEIFVTLKNIGNEVIRGAVLQTTVGDCTASVQGRVTVDTLGVGESVRVPQGIVVEPNTSCQSGSIGKVTLSGDYTSAAGRPALAGTASYLVGALEIFTGHEEAMAVAIPDKSVPISKTFEVAQTGLIKDISVAVKIKHPYVGDLAVFLLSPTGKKVVLRTQEGGGADDLTARWGRGGDSHAGLEGLANEEARGTWTIQVQDAASGDVGTWEDAEIVLRHW